MRVAGVLLGGGASTRFGTPKLEARLGGRRLVDIACANFLDAGLEPVVFAGRVKPEDERVLLAEPGAAMIETLRAGLRLLPEGPFAFAPADMPALHPELVHELMQAFLDSGRAYLLPVHGVCRGHPAFAWRREPFFRLGEAAGPREIWREAGDELTHFKTETADILFDVDTPDDLAAAATEPERRARLLARGDLRC